MDTVLQMVVEVVVLLYNDVEELEDNQEVKRVGDIEKIMHRKVFVIQKVEKKDLVDLVLLQMELVLQMLVSGTDYMDELVDLLSLAFAISLDDFETRPATKEKIIRKRPLFPLPFFFPHLSSSKDL